MGRRGPKPTPTPLLKLRGSWRAETRDGEPSPTTELPPCPAWVRPAARKHWGEIGEMLEGLGLIAKPHTLALAMLCEALADWISDHDAKAWERVLKACREFGMTPSAMSAVRSVKSDETKPGIKQFKLA
jgi:phage terminase small subunit